MVIRDIEEHELTLLSDTAERLWHQAYDSLLSPAQISYMLEMFQSSEAFGRMMREGCLIRGIFEREELMGYAVSRLDGDRIFLSKLYLDTCLHNMGWGRKLVEDTIAHYPQASAVYLTVNKHNSAVEFYSHIGFHIIDSVVSDIGEGFVMDDFIMQRDLESRVNGL